MGYLTPVSQFNQSKGTVKIGDTLFVDGTPYTVCGRCELPIKKFTYGEVETHSATYKDRQTYKSGGSTQRVLKEYRIFLGFWKESEESTFDSKGVESITIKWIPIIHSKSGCFDCWNEQEQERQRNKALGVNKAVFFNISRRIKK